MINQWVKTFLLITHSFTHLLKNGSSSTKCLFKKLLSLEQNVKKWGKSKVNKSLYNSFKTLEGNCVNFRNVFIN